MAETNQKIVRMGELKLVISGAKSKMDAAIAAAKYTLPVAGTALGGVKNGGNVTVSGTGTMSVAASTATVAGVITENRVTELAGAKAQALIDAIPTYSLPTASATVLGGVKVGENITATAGTISVPDATESVKGVMTTKDVDDIAKAAVAAVVDGAPEELDTLSELAKYLTDDTVAGGVVKQMAGKADKATVEALTTTVNGKANKATSLSGYGITDCKIAGGVITIGGNSIAPLTSHQSLAAYAKSADVTALATRVTTLEGSAGNLEYMTEADATAMVTEIFG